MKTQEDILGIISLRQASLSKAIEKAKKQRDLKDETTAYRSYFQGHINRMELEIDQLDALIGIIADKRPIEILLETNYCQGF